MLSVEVCACAAALKWFRLLWEIVIFGIVNAYAIRGGSVHGIS